MMMSHLLLMIWLEELRFLDDLHGMMFLSGSNGSSSVYYTKNGGMSWKRLWKTQRNVSAEVDGAYRYPDLTPPPAHAPLWTKQDDFYKITGILRFRKGRDNYVVENYNYDAGKEWKVVSIVATHQQSNRQRFKRRSEMCPQKKVSR